MEQVAALNIDVIAGTINALPRLVDKGDETLWVTFEMASHFNDVATREAGRPVFEMREYIKIVIPGDATNIVHRPVRPTDLERFPRQYQAFKLGTEQQIGTPLSSWAGISRAQVDELSWFKVQTVEQLANISDSVAQKFMGVNQLRDRAKAYLETIKGEAPALKLQAEIDKKDEELRAQQAQIDMLMAAVKELQEKNEKKGRKGREAEEAA